MPRGRTGPLLEFSCRSRIDPDLAEATTLWLIRRSWSVNTRTGITGLLRRDGGRLEQTLEGPRELVLVAASRILSDRRHGAIEIRAFGPIAARRHATWRAEGFDNVAAAPAGRAAGLRLAWVGTPAMSPGICSSAPASSA